MIDVDEYDRYQALLKEHAPAFSAASGNHVAQHAVATAFFAALECHHDKKREDEEMDLAGRLDCNEDEEKKDDAMVMASRELFSLAVQRASAPGEDPGFLVMLKSLTLAEFAEAAGPIATDTSVPLEANWFKRLRMAVDKKYGPAASLHSHCCPKVSQEAGGEEGGQGGRCGAQAIARRGRHGGAWSSRDRRRRGTPRGRGAGRWRRR